MNDLYEKKGVDKNGHSYTRLARAEQGARATTKSGLLPQRRPDAPTTIATNAGQQAAEGVYSIKTAGGVTTHFDEHGLIHRGAGLPAVERFDGTADWVEHGHVYMYTRPVPGFKYDNGAALARAVHYVELKKHGWVAPKFVPVYHSFTEPVAKDSADKDVYAVYGYRVDSAESAENASKMSHSEFIAKYANPSALLLAPTTAERMADARAVYGDDLTGRDKHGFNVSGRDIDGYDLQGRNAAGRARDGRDAQTGLNAAGKTPQNRDAAGRDALGMTRAEREQDEREQRRLNDRRPRDIQGNPL
jgi:hypothetical protein